jgi:hypothetical protein
MGGKNTVPEPIMIDVESEEWFAVEAERAAHDYGSISLLRFNLALPLKLSRTPYKAILARISTPPSLLYWPKRTEAVFSGVRIQRPAYPYSHRASNPHEQLEGG